MDTKVKYIFNCAVLENYSLKMEVFGGGYAPGCEIVTEVNIQPGY